MIVRRIKGPMGAVKRLALVERQLEAVTSALSQAVEKAGPRGGEQILAKLQVELVDLNEKLRAMRLAEDR